jgi:hypothetical protein
MSARPSGSPSEAGISTSRLCLHIRTAGAASSDSIFRTILSARCGWLKPTDQAFIREPYSFAAVSKKWKHNGGPSNAGHELQGAVSGPR